MRKLLLRAAVLLVFCTILGVAGLAYILWHYSRGLPDYQALLTYQPPVMTRIYTGDGRLLAEYAEEKRIFVPINAIPPLVKHAFIAAEDKNFYHHGGVDFMSILRASAQNLSNIADHRRPVGASTITQQVAKNMLLTNEFSLDRKIKEAILAYRLERALSKDRILELYLNQIYLGSTNGGSYGVAAAALNYFNRSLDDLTPAEAAYLASLPKAPNNYNPVTNNDKARARRDWVLDHMAEENYITLEQKTAAQASPLVITKRSIDEVAHADYFAEEVRRDLVQRYGDSGLYRGGLAVHTSLVPKLQTIGERVFKHGLEDYDRRHGWRGPIGHGSLADLDQRLATTVPPSGIDDWHIAGVTRLSDSEAEIRLKSGASGKIAMSELTWARLVKDDQLGSTPKKPSDVLNLGDVIYVEAVKLDGGKSIGSDTYTLRQIPVASGGLLAMDPHTGRVLAMVGGVSFELSQFNRATQAMRQSGSSFKPFVYMAALDSGLTPSTIVLDEPFVYDQGPGLPKWKPANYGDKFLGAVPLRTGIEQSRNLMTVRIAAQIGMPKVAEYAEKFGVVDHLEPVLAMAIGAGETTLLRMVTAYSMIVNGGKQLVPSLIDRIQNNDGKNVYRHDARDCSACNATEWNGAAPPDVPDTRAQIEDPATAYQVLNMMEGVVQRGTGIAVAAVHKPLAGKTGTTNDFTDAWFVGFSPDLAVGIYIGYDTPKTLGPKETGGRISAPIFRDFMIDALANQPATPFRIPPGVIMVRINPTTGRLAEPGDPKAILAPYKPGTEPSEDGSSETVIGGGLDPDAPQNLSPTAAQDKDPTVGVGGLY